MNEKKLKKYLKDTNKPIIIHGDFPWNCRIESVELIKSTIWFKIYWQGDSTDGNKRLMYEQIKTITEFNPYVISAEHFFDGERTRTIHDDLRITKEMVDEAFKIIDNVLDKQEDKA